MGGGGAGYHSALSRVVTACNVQLADEIMIISIISLIFIFAHAYRPDITAPVDWA